MLCLYETVDSMAIYTLMSSHECALRNTRQTGRTRVRKLTSLCQDRLNRDSATFGLLKTVTVKLRSLLSSAFLVKMTLDIALNTHEARIEPLNCICHNIF
jgi:hypothetical protein